MTWADDAGARKTLMTAPRRGPLPPTFAIVMNMSNAMARGPLAEKLSCSLPMLTAGGIRTFLALRALCAVRPALFVHGFGTLSPNSAAGSVGHFPPKVTHMRSWLLADCSAAVCAAPEHFCPGLPNPNPRQAISRTLPHCTRALHCFGARHDPVTPRKLSISSSLATCQPRSSVSC